MSSLFIGLIAAIICSLGVILSKYIKKNIYNLKLCRLYRRNNINIIWLENLIFLKLSISIELCLLIIVLLS